jgi:hypothetical protein
MFTDCNHTDLREPSYYDFLMRNRGRRPVAPFEVVAGRRPRRIRDVRPVRISCVSRHAGEDTGM